MDWRERSWEGEYVGREEEEEMVGSRSKKVKEEGKKRNQLPSPAFLSFRRWIRGFEERGELKDSRFSLLDMASWADREEEG